MKRPLHWILAGLTVLLAATGFAEDEKKPLKALLITGGCCHDYEFQSKALTLASAAKADIEWTVVNKGGDGTEAQIDLYSDPNWAKGYDVVVHNECFANTKDPAYVQKIVEGHKGGTPAVVVHCAMHTYRAMESDEWRQFLGVTSRHHEHQSKYPVNIEQPEHPIMKGVPANWITPMDELYIIEKVWPHTTVLATSKSEKSNKSQPVIWTNDYNGTRVFGTTYGHSNDTFGDKTYLDILTRGILWAAGKLE
ncbi:MAG: ThuA domain-containing protein [Verrucomicrobia bacterium]|nr:ThuA domain-containing protein [Verrucomicrobiota bacterium]MDA1005995.1 ThuA domain-containing protein [Verrucomicrobiota bacterium]